VLRQFQQCLISYFYLIPSFKNKQLKLFLSIFPINKIRKLGVEIASMKALLSSNIGWQFSINQKSLIGGAWCFPVLQSKNLFQTGLVFF
jgi:hypothetical protein